MNQILDFFKNLFDSADWPPRWHCGKWTEFHGWLYILSDLLIWTAYFSIPIVIIKYLYKKKTRRFTRLYFLFAAFILACGATHFLDAVAFWVPLYRLSALFRFITGIISWITVFYLVKYLPVLLSLRPIEALEAEIEQRKQSEEKFRGLLEAAPDAIVIVNKSGEIVIINRQTEKLFGYKKEELIGKMVEILIPASLGAGHKKKREHYTSEPHVRTMGAGLELEAVKKDGSKFPVEISLSPLVTAEGTLISASVRDITERVKTARKLKQAKDDFQLLIHSVKDYAIIMLDKEGKIATWNNGAAHIKGYSETEIIGQPVDVFYMPEEKELGAPARNLQLALQHGRYETEGWRLKKDGTAFWADIIITSLYDADKQWYGYVKVTRDITEKKKTDERIRFLATIAGNIQDPVISTDNDYHITQWNKAAEKLFGWTSDEVTGRKTSEILGTIYPYESREQILQSYEENDSWQGEVIYHTKSGNPVNVLATVSHLRDAKNNITGNLVLARDITLRKKAENALSRLNEELEQKVKDRTEAFRQSEEQYRYLFQNNPMPMWVINLADFKFLDVNEMATLQYGYSREEFLSMTAVDIRPEEDAITFIQSDHSFESTDLNYNKGIWRHRKKDGSIILVDIIAHKIMFEGIPARLILAHDVTEQQQAEEKLVHNEKRFRALVENSNDIISLLSDKRIHLYRSPSAERITGYSLEERIKSQVMGEIHPDDSPTFERSFAEVMNKPGKTIPFTYRLKHRNGHYIWLDGTFTNMMHEPAVGAIVGNMRDITERKNIEEKIIKLNEELEEKVIIRTEQLRRSNEELEAFSYSVSHDLRAPLRGIIGFTNILEEDYGSKLDDEAKRITAIIKHNTVKMGTLIDDLLSFSRTGRQPINKTEVNSNEIISELINEPALKTGNHINWIVPVLPAVKADPVTIKQVWMNLLSNAAKYSAKQQNPVIEIGSLNGKNETIFFVKDNGVGFDTRYSDKLFKVFQRLHAAADFEGTGVGLAIVEKIITRHGGRAWAEATLGKGACFYFSIPG